jgi:hypothetical protein
MICLHFSDIIRAFLDCMSKDCVPTIVRRIPINQFVRPRKHQIGPQNMVFLNRMPHGDFIALWSLKPIHTFDAIP